MTETAPGAAEKKNKVWRKRLNDAFAALAAQATKQQGLIHTKQLKRFGISRRTFAYEVLDGRWIRLHENVFMSSTVRRTTRIDLLAICMQLANGAVVSHVSAAELHGLPVPESSLLHVATPKRGRGRDGIVVHERWDMQPPDRDHVDGLPVTSPTRTIRDCFALLPLDDAEALVEAGINRRLTTEAELLRCHERLKGRGYTGAKNFSLLMALRGREPAAGSNLEVEFLQLLRRNGIPAPSRQVQLNAGDRTRRVDFMWEHAGVVAEIDGRAYHAKRAAFDGDAKTRTALQAKGLKVLVFTFKAIRYDPQTVVAQLRQALKLASQTELPLPP